MNANLDFLREYPLTGPGTIAGRMLRHYWHPVCLSGDLIDLPYPVRMLGEDLVAFRGQDGNAGLVGRTCPHRCASLEYAQIRAHGLQCSYHGWTFNQQGRCVDMPLEPEDSKARDRVRVGWYPVQEWAGVVWCYMGEDRESPPPMPKIDILAREDGEVVLERNGDVRNYNYLSWIENVLDMGHAYVLHMLVPGMVPPEMQPYCDLSTEANWRRVNYRAFETHYGVKVVGVHGTADPDKKFVNTWSIALPTHFRFGGIAAGLPPDFSDDRRESGGMLRIIDDEHFEIFRYTLIRPGNFRGTFFPRKSDKSRGLAEGIAGLVDKKSYDHRRYAGWEGRPPLEDLVIQESQGAVPPRNLENLVTSDIGVALLRRVFRKSMEDVAAGGKPKPMETNAEGLLEVDTFKGFAKPAEIHLGPGNMPSSHDGRGLLRNSEGKLAFG